MTTDGLAGSEPGYDELLTTYVDALVAGEKIDSDAIRSAHPEHADQLLGDLAAFVDPGVGDETGARALGTLGDYTLRRQIGRGGMGVVYEAWQGSLDRQVALKILPAGIAADDKAFHRFMREAKTTARLNHPNIVGVHGVGIEQNTPYYTMEFVEGETLAQILTRIKDADETVETPFGPKDDIRYFGNIAAAFADLADGLQHAHSKGVVHRDVKPSNLILDEEDGRLRILDFGLARLEGHESLTISGDVVGTPLYMSPEQARRKKVSVDHRTDLYSLGATMYEVFCGRPPFRGRDHADTLSQIIERDPAEPTKMNPRVPQDLATIALKCLRKDAHDRYGTAEALGQDLRRFVRGDPVEARPMPSWEKTLRKVWRHRVRVGATTAVVVVGVLGATLGGILWKQSRDKALERYEGFVSAGMDALEVGLLATSGELQEGQRTLSLGIINPLDLRWRSSDLSGRAFEAIDLLRKAIEIFPARPEAYVHLSRALRAVGRDNESRRALHQALDCDRNFLPAILHETYALRETGDRRAADLLLKSLGAAVADGWERLWLDAHLRALDGDWERVDRLCTELLAVSTPPFIGFEKELRLKRGRVRLKRGLGLPAFSDFHYIREASGGAAGPSLLLAAAYFVIDQRDDAVACLDETLADGTASDLEIRAIITLYLRFGERKAALRAIDRLADPCERYQSLLMATEDWSSDVKLAEEALSEGCEDPFVYQALAEALAWTGRQSEMKELLLEALEKRRAEPTLVLSYLRALSILCEEDEIIQSARKFALQGHPRPKEMDQLIGWAYYRKGELESARAKLTEAIEYWPRDPSAFKGRFTVHYLLGDFSAALNDALKSAQLHAPYLDDYPFIRQLYREENRKHFAGRWDEIDATCKGAIRSGTGTSPRYLGFQALASLYRSEPNKDLALELAEKSVEEGTTLGHLWLPETLGYLGEVHFVREENVEAIRTLERAVALPGCWKSTAEDLSRYRRKLLPRLLSCASVDAYLEGKLSDGRDTLPDFARVRKETTPGSAAGRYLEARLLDREDDLEGAASMLEELEMDPEVEPVVILRLADLKARLGARDEALGLIEKHFAGAKDFADAPWVLWMRLASQAAALSTSECLERLEPVLEEREGSGDSGGNPALADFVFGLRSLLNDGAIRIHCGGDREHIDAEKKRWGFDRFFTGGRAFGFPRPALSVSVDRELYYRYREFLVDWSARNGYQIPLPPGRYELVLRFCATTRAWQVRFFLSVEGEPVRELIELKEDPGVRVVVEERFHVDVSDGALNLEFVPKGGDAVAPNAGGALVNAIEVRRLGGASRSPPLERVVPVGRRVLTQ